MTFKLAVLAAATSLLVACSTPQISEIDHSQGSVLLNQKSFPQIATLRPASIQAEPSDIYLRKVNSRKKEIHLVSMKYKQLPLAEAVNKSKPGINFIALDGYVDIKKKVDVYVNGMNFTTYLKYLSSLSGYLLTENDGMVTARSYMDMTFNMAAMVDNQNTKVSTSMAGNQSSTLVSTSSTEKWSELLDVCSSILGVENWNGHGSRPYCNGVRSVGIIAASGQPSKMDILNTLFKDSEELATKMVLVEVKWLDISLGRRETLKQTSLMIKNNTTAIVNIGTSYKIATNEKSNGGVELSDIDVGLSFSITPRILGNKEVQLDIIPSVSSINDWRDNELSTAVAASPDIQFSNFATQVITRSDKAVQVGEFSDAEITTLVSRNLNGSNSDIDNSMNNLLTADGNSMRKIIMVVTPKIISGV